MGNTLQNQQFQRTDLAIKQAFLARIRESPIEKMTVSEICKEVGINRSSFYYHYDDLYALLSALLEDLNADLLQRLSEQEEFLSKGSLLIYLEHIRSYQELYQLIHLSRVDFPLEDSQQEMRDYLQKQEKFQGLGEGGLETALVFLQAGFTHTIRFWLASHCQMKIEELLGILQTFLQ